MAIKSTVNEEMYFCSYHKRMEPISNFRQTKNGKTLAWCREARLEHQKAYYRAHKEQYKVYTKRANEKKRLKRMQEKAYKGSNEKKIAEKRVNKDIEKNGLSIGIVIGVVAVIIVYFLIG